MAPNPHGTLSQERVSQAIDRTLSRATNEVRNLLRDRHYLTVRRVEDWGTILSNTGALDTHLQNRTPWHFGLVIHDDADQNDDWIGLVTFNIAYSSWSGRILYLDQMQGDGRLNDDVEKRLLQLLAEIAISLDCARLTWRHPSTPDWHLNGTNQPEMHGEVLTLSMDDDAMKVFVGADILREVEVESQGETMLDAFSSTLEVMNQSCDSGFRLRLAKEEDLQIVEDLVQGLADYVKESDAVELTAKDYLNDGFSLDDPLWHCILIDKIHDEGDSHTCGYAFFYVGYNLGQGRFLYLEDLYIQSKDRGVGGGKLTMKALAAMALSSKCHRMYWQALDWNTASLKFYDNIGAKIHVGERTSRYAGIALERFASELRA